MWERRNNTVMPFNETVQQVYARVSALRDSLDGPQVISISCQHTCQLYNFCQPMFHIIGSTAGPIALRVCCMDAMIDLAFCATP